jgi:hypothetical protein
LFTFVQSLKFANQIEMKNIIKSTLVLAGIVSVTMISCRRDRDSDTNSAQDNSLAESSFDDANDMADQVGKGGTLELKLEADASLLSTCATVTRDTTTDPKTITIDFGSSNCTCSDGRVRRGKVLVSYTGKYREVGAHIVIGFEDYYVNDNHIEGTRTIDNEGFNADNNLVFHVVVDGTVTKSDGTVILWTCDKTREWVEGYDTDVRTDDVYEVTGTASGTRANGTTFTAETVTALTRKVSCHQFVSGQLRLTPSGKPERLIDFGNGDCDDEATVTINGNDYTIQLH